MYDDLQERWYVIADAAELRAGRPLALRRFGQALVLWRDAHGRVAGLVDRCPHRGVPLSRGKVVQGCIECPFHGFRWSGEGQCVRMPAEGDAPGLMSRYRAPALVLRETHGWIWLWRGQPREAYPEIESFDAIGAGDAQHTWSVVWNTNYIRVIENQIDFTHLAFVHETTIGAGMPKARLDVHTRVDGDRIRAWADDPRKLRPGRPGTYVELLAPNLWILTFARNMSNVAAFVPIDETHTQIYMRLYQRVITIPGLAWLLCRVMSLSNRVILSQDRRVVEGSQPPRPAPSHRELLVPSDAPIIAYRRLLAREARLRARGTSARSAESRYPAGDPTCGT